MILTSRSTKVLNSTLAGSGSLVHMGLQGVDGVMIYDLGVTDVFVPDAKREFE